MKACCDEHQKDKTLWSKIRDSDYLAAFESILPLMINVGAQFPRMASFALRVITQPPTDIRAAKTISRDHPSAIISPLDAGISQASKGFPGLYCNIPEAKLHNMNICDALVVVGCALRGYRFNFTGDVF